MIAALHNMCARRSPQAEEALRKAEEACEATGVPDTPSECVYESVRTSTPVSVSVSDSLALSLLSSYRGC